MFVNDLETDSKINRWTQSQYAFYKTYYQPSHLLGWFTHVYSVIVLFKALNRIWKYSHYFPYMTSCSFMGVNNMNLSTVPEFTLNIFDPNGLLLWLWVMILNQVFVNSSIHPFLVNFRQNTNIMTKWIWVSVLSSISIALPKAYLITWIGYLSTHILLRTMTKYYRKL